MWRLYGALVLAMLKSYTLYPRPYPNTLSGRDGSGGITLALNGCMILVVASSGVNEGCIGILVYGCMGVWVVYGVLRKTISSPLHLKQIPKNTWKFLE